MMALIFAMGAGGKTQMSSLINAGFVFLTLMFLMPLFENLPHATLAAIVIHAMLGLMDFGYLKRLSGISREHGHANLGFWVRSSATGRGIATKAARSVTASPARAAGGRMASVPSSPTLTRSNRLTGLGISGGR